MFMVLNQECYVPCMQSQQVKSYNTHLSS